jgi:S-adenosylmethionine:tRNA ribosyltransferase-isomerase
MIKLNDYDYFLPKEKIAQYPEKKRDHSKLMILTKNQIQHIFFYQLIDEIKSGDVFVVNNSKVIASNLKGKKETGGKIECLFLREINHDTNLWECLLKGRKLKVGGKILFLNGGLIGTIMQWQKVGQFLVEFRSNEPIQEILKENAAIILPPYIKAVQNDISRYQTVYASIDGSVAAPTAGFHFTPELIQQIEKKGAKFVSLTLHVGYSTFRPLTDEIFAGQETMDPEYFSLSQPSSIEIIENCIQQGHRLIAVGTTTLKALESVFDSKGKVTRQEGWSDIFIAPGYKFKSAVSQMITNFHMPKSPPLLMVCGFAGKERIFQAYQEAISKNYRFYSFGDAMFVDKE